MRVSFVLLLVVALIAVTLAGRRGRKWRGGGGRRRGGSRSSSSHISDSSESSEGRNVTIAPTDYSSEISSSEESQGRDYDDTSRSRERGGRGRGYRPRGGPRGRPGRPWRGYGPRRPIGPSRNRPFDYPRRFKPGAYACQLKNESKVIKSRACPARGNATVFCSGDKLNVTYQNKSAEFTFCNYTNKRVPDYQSILINKACHVTKLTAKGVIVNTRRAKCRCLRRRSECSGGPIVIPYCGRWELSLLFCKKRNETFDPLNIFGRDKDEEIDEPVDGTDDGNPGTDDGDTGTGEGNPGTDDGDQGTGEGNPGTTDMDQGTGEGNPGTTDSGQGTGDGDPGTGDGDKVNIDNIPGLGDENIGTTDANPGTDDTNPGDVDAGNGDVAVIDDIFGNNGSPGGDGGDVAISN